MNLVDDINHAVTLWGGFCFFAIVWKHRFPVSYKHILAWMKSSLIEFSSSLTRFIIVRLENLIACLKTLESHSKFPNWLSISFVLFLFSIRLVFSSHLFCFQTCLLKGLVFDLSRQLCGLFTTEHTLGPPVSSNFVALSYIVTYRLS